MKTIIKLTDGIFWPIPITLSIEKTVADTIKESKELALVDTATGELMGSMLGRIFMLSNLGGINAA